MNDRPPVLATIGVGMLLGVILVAAVLLGEEYGPLVRMAAGGR